MISQVPCAHLFRRIPHFFDRGTDQSWEILSLWGMLPVSYLCSRDRPRHLNRSFKYEYVSEAGVAREIVPPSLTLEQVRAIDDQVVRQVSAISTEGANLTFSDDYENGGLRN